MSFNYRFILIVSAACALTMSAAAAQAPAPAPAIDTTAIDRALGRSGQQQGDVYRVSFPRTDLKVAVKGLPLRAGFALGSWAAFEKAGSDSVVHGDLVLTESELDPVISRLFENGLEITAVHNHILEETPRVMYVHFWGRGDAVKLADGLHTALAASGTPATASPAAAAAEDPDLHADVIQQHLGKTGAVRGGVLAISIPRPEKITMMGVDMPPAMGMATALNFQAAGSGNVAATGDFVMIGDEVNPVAKALRQNGISIRALHNHMIHGAPELYFMHFWVVGPPERVADGLRAAVDLLKK